MRGEDDVARSCRQWSENLRNTSRCRIRTALPKLAPLAISGGVSLVSRDYEPVPGKWYENQEEEETFRVLTVDEDAELVEIEYVDGEIEELDVDTWHEMDLELTDEPEGWSESDEDDDEEEDEDYDDDEDEDDDDDDDDDDDLDEETKRKAD